MDDGFTVLQQLGLIPGDSRAAKHGLGVRRYPSAPQDRQHTPILPRRSRGRSVHHPAQLVASTAWRMSWVAASGCDTKET
jgi:hypothetical protein